MRWERFFTTPPPPAAWALAEGSLAVLHREKRGEDVCAGAVLDPGVFGVGPVGLQSVDRERLVQVLADLQERVHGIRRPAATVPTNWVRVNVLELETVPRRRADLDDVVRWRLKKVLPVRPEELRFDLIPVSSSQEGTKLVCVSGLERSYAELEAAFEDAGMQLAVVTPRIFAISAAVGPTPETVMIVHLDRAMLAVLVTRKGRIDLLRTKWLPQNRPLEPIITRELDLTVLYLRERLEIGGEISIVGSAEGEMSPDVIDNWMLEQEMMHRLPALPVPACPDHDELDRSLLPPAWAMIHGGGI